MRMQLFELFSLLYFSRSFIPFILSFLLSFSSNRTFTNTYKQIEADNMANTIFAREKIGM
jgi:hypothetical protein